MVATKEKFLARVVDNQDDQKRGRIRVTCADLSGDHEFVLPDWVEPSFMWGMFIVPDVGELVEIECNSGNDLDDGVPFQAFLQNPDIKWTTVRQDSLVAGTPRPTNILFTESNYGKRRGFATPAGHVLMFDDTDQDQQVTLTWRRGSDFSQMTIDKNGSIIMLDRKSNMIHINATDDEEAITMIDKHGDMITMREAGVLINDHFGNYIEMADGQVNVMAADDLSVRAGKGVYIQAGVGAASVEMDTGGDVTVTAPSVTIDTDEYNVGNGADSPFVRWTELAAWLDGHTHLTAFGPSGPGATGVLGPFASAGANSTIGTLKSSIWASLCAFCMWWAVILYGRL